MKLSDFSLHDERDEIVERPQMAAFLERVNQTASSYPRDKTVAGIFIEQAMRTPDATAVIYLDSRLSYQELDRWSNQLASFLLAQGLKPEGMVGVMLDSSPAAIVSMLGTLKAGGAYLPIPPELPFERIKHMLRDSRASVLISAQSQSEMCGRLMTECPDLKHLLVVRGKSDKTLPGCDVEFEFEGTVLDTSAEVTSVDRSQPNTLAYVMYTSGSTGRPKGVMIEHQAILRLVLNTNYISIGAGACIAQAANISFDAATFEIWGALLNGATVLLLSRDELLDTALFARQLRERRFNILFLTTALFNRFARMDQKMFASLDSLLFGGEVVDARSVIEVKKSGGSPRRLLHVYGPTESTTFATWHEIREDVGREIPIGAPIANTSVYILDEKFEPTGIGVNGELCIGGEGLARGYLNDAALTARKFIPHPFAVGERLYRTGDVACWRADGNIDFVTRTDDQVKVRGFRIEPGEIQTRLLQSGQLTEAIVVAKSDEEGDRRLIAYFVANTQVDVGELRNYLAETLPDYMIPSFFVQMDRLPLTSNGKVDKSALSDPNLPSTAAEHSRADLPTTETEQTMLTIWHEVLGQPNIGVNDNFFENGGHSINAVKLMHLIHKRIGFSLPFTLLFKAPTVRQLTQCILDATRFGKAEIDEPMVKLRTAQNGRTIFAFPPGTGDALSYARLAEHLDQYTFYAFNFIEHQSRFTDYANLISSVEPEPYFLFGYSGGGNLAFQTAEELESRGLKVSNVVMLDSSRFLEQFRFPEEEPRRLANNYLAEEGVRDYVTSQVLKDKALRIIEKYYDTLSSNPQNQIINANIHVVVSENSQDTYHDESGRLICSKSAWGEITRGKLTIYQGHGDHAHMLHRPHREPNIAILRDIFEVSLKGAERSAASS